MPGRPAVRAAGTGLLEEGREILEEDSAPEVLGAALISAARRVQHYEMAAYGCLRTYARLLGRDEAAELLQAAMAVRGEEDA